ncbi:MAG: DNA primase [Alphaproteobacteria bacterium]|nr:DNA primase [Alphaproteobacteria bacterium]
MAFSPEFLDELRARLSLAGVVGRRVRLTKRGRDFVGLCPFHNEKTPSFNVVEEKGFFHCFGCGAHGDVVGFVMRAEGLQFPEAVEKLAAEAGLPLPKAAPEQARALEQQHGLLAALEAACVFFEAQLRTPAGATARDYLLGRGLDGATAKRFRLGWAPESRQGLGPVLAKQGFDETVLVQAGLRRSAEDGSAFDFFRGRVVIPITDRRGRVIAFGARALGDAQPKYLNSPETPVFHKGRTLYAIAQAAGPARKAGTIIVAEGYMDVIALHRSGIEHAVAPLGTALTEEQLDLLWRLVEEPTLCFDGDSAGRRAAARAADRAWPLLAPGRSLRFCFLPEGEDPDSLIRKHGRQAMTEALDQSRPMAEVMWALLLEAQPSDTPERRARLRTLVEERVKAIADRSVQEEYRRDFRARLAASLGESPPSRSEGASPRRPPAASVGSLRGLGFDEHAALRFLRRGERRQDVEVRRLTERTGADASLIRQRAEAALIAAACNHPGAVADEIEEFAAARMSDPTLRKLRAALADVVAADPDLDRAGLDRHLRDAGWSGVLDSLLSEQVYQHAAFARPDSEPDVVRTELRARIGQLAADANQADERSSDLQALAECLDDEAWERFRRKWLAQGDADTADGDAGPGPGASWHGP